MWGSGTAIAAGYLTHLLFADASMPHWLHTFSHSCFELVNTVWWGVALGVLMISILGRVPRQFVMSVLGTKSGLRGVLRATLGGVLLDLCNHGILMVGAKLYERGASTGQVMAFLMASPWNSFSLTVLLVTLIGVPWTLGFIVLSMAIAVVTGVVFDKLVSHGVLAANRHQASLPPDFRFWSEAKTQLAAVEFNRAFFAETLRAGLKESRMVVRWILFGVVLASLLRAFVPVEVFSNYLGPTLLGLAVTVTAATVIEVCSEGSAPLAAEIFNTAGAPGNSFAFLMGGVATDYTEIMVLKDTTGSLKTALFLPLISLPQIVVLAWVINQAAI